MKFLGLLVFIGFAGLSFANEGHDKKEKSHKEHTVGEKNHEEEKDHNEAGHKHEGEAGHEEKEHDEAGHDGEKGHEEAGHKHEGEEGHEEENTQVGPDKGILEASESQGIKLSPEAEKNFDIAKSKVTNASSIQLPKSAIVTAGTEINLFRLRNGFYKRVDFNLVSKNGNSILVKSTDLTAGDEVVTSGMNFIRLAEIAAFGGAAEGHSH